MQGFNRYIPPDFDPQKNHTLNDYQGKKALGDRERKRDQGILITRFELPFNIWCGTCNGHIGMGVRYNAEKKKIGNYYSTPIYSFRCKCHLCSGWFEIQTDPKNTKYIVTSGAKQKDEEWDPEENGGFPIHDTDPDKPPEDPLASLEKTTAAQTNLEKVVKPRIESLQTLSEHYNSDPFSLSSKARKKFREEKKLDKRKREADDDFKSKYSLHPDLPLVSPDEVAEDAREGWAKERKEHEERLAQRRRLNSEAIPSIALRAVSKIPIQAPKQQPRDEPLEHPLRKARSTSVLGTGGKNLASTLLLNTLKRTDPFISVPSGSRGPKNSAVGVVLRK